MTQDLSADLLPRAKQVLLPLVGTEDDREALLIDAFYLHDPLLDGIDLRGSATSFASRLTKKLLDYGYLTDGEHSLARLLLTARDLCGVDKHAEIDELVGIANELSRVVERPAKSTSTSAVSASPAPVVTIDTPRDGRRPTVFISYAHEDREFVTRLAFDLRSAGHACWIDAHSTSYGDDDWITMIAEGITNSYAFVTIVSLNALRSRWVRREIMWALHKKRQIIPVMLENVADDNRFFPLVEYLRVTVCDEDYTQALDKLLRSLPPWALSDASASDSSVGPAEEIAGDTLPHPRRIDLPRTANRKVELAYMERLKLEELLNTEKYTPMAGTSEQRLARAEMRAVFELLPMNRGHQPQQERHQFDDAVKEILRIRRAVLLGEPGAGKTTTIWKLAAELVADALKTRKAPIPLLVRLGRWTGADQPIGEFIATQLGDLGENLDHLLTEKRAALLLDGLNELPAGQRDIKYPQVQRLIEQHPDLMAIVSCRELDYTTDLGFDCINILPLDPIRIREFAGHYLEEEQGEALFWKLAGNEAKDTLERFVDEFTGKLADPEQVFWVEQELPKSLRWGYSWSENDNSFWQQWLRLRETPSSLMVLVRNPYMLLMLTSVYKGDGLLPDNRGDLFRRFVEQLLKREEELLKREQVSHSEQQQLMDGLAKVAFQMQTRRPAADQRETGDALTALPRADVKPILGERMLYLAGSASILSVGEQVRFTHQLLQEYFAARYMQIEFEAGRLKAARLWPKSRWWERTNWEEAAILLVGLYSDDCSSAVEWVAEVNPEVAAMCVARSGASLGEATRDRLARRWIPRLTDLKSDPQPRARASIGRALGLTGWDNRKGVGIVVDGNGVALPDIDWVEIPGGEFQYGDDGKYAAEPQRLTLPTFHVSRYPVTYAQFQTFLDDPAGYSDSRWFDGLAADENGRRMEEQYFKYSNHPRETVNWYQAMAFCRWLSWRLGGRYDVKKAAEWAVRLPTEYEWEKAARGTDGRIYPYVGKFDQTKCNTREGDLDQTSAVGIFPNGASPYGVMDMSGNVWEWCLSNYYKPALDARKEDLRTDKTRVLRGGSWDLISGFARAVCRFYNHPGYRRYIIGFRVVVCGGPPSL